MIEMKHIVKTYSSVKALDDVSFTLHPGEIHALLGENGAGKSTLMKVLYGMTQPDAGTIELDGRTQSFHKPSDAIAAGIGMVHQHFMLAGALTVTENVIVGAEPGTAAAVDYKAAAKIVAEMIERFSFTVQPDKKVSTLPIGEMQQVEILKLLFRGASTLILDEPTAVLSPIEVDRLFEVLRGLKAQGKSCVIITHKLYEVLQIADRITIMRNGVVTGHVESGQMQEISADQLAEYMVGRALVQPVRRSGKQSDEVRLRLRDLNYSVKKQKLLDNVCLDIHAGEILGIAGVEGNGQSELVKILTGNLKPDSMELLLDGEPLCGNAKSFLRSGVGHIPEDRLKYAVAEDMTIEENLILGYEDTKDFCRRGLLRHGKIQKTAKERLKKYHIKAAGSKSTIRQLSGGNQQKVVIARVFEAAPKVMICSQLTRGVDIGASEYFYQLLHAYSEKGNAVLLVSSDLQEVLAHSDTVGVMYHGRLSTCRPAGSYTMQSIGLLMVGGKEGSEEA